MKLELLISPNVRQITIGRNFKPDIVKEYEETQIKSNGDTLKVMGGQFICLAHHLYYTFYFQLPPDYLIEILCYSQLKATRNTTKDEDEGLLSGSLHSFIEAMTIFCTKRMEKDLRQFFNRVGALLELDGIQLPFSKIDVGDTTYWVKL